MKKYLVIFNDLFEGEIFILDALAEGNAVMYAMDKTKDTDIRHYEVFDLETLETPYRRTIY